MRGKKLVLLTFGMVLLLFNNVGFTQEALNKKLIENWIGAQEELSVWSKKYEDKIEKYENNAMPNTPNDLLAPLKQAGLYKEFRSKIKKYGFDNPESWASYTLRIFNAVTASQMQGAMQNINIKEQIAQIEKSEYMNEEQKQQMISSLKTSLASLEQMRQAPAADIAAIKPYIGRIMSVLDSESN